MTVSLTSPTRVHLLGIGGAGMSGMARILLQRGHHVSGSDLKDGLALDELRALGAQVQIGHEVGVVADADVVVVSSAVDSSNPEFQHAIDAGVTVLRRAEMLATLMEDERRVLVTGTHGKTTTTSMAVVALQSAGGDPSFAIGGQLNEAGTNAHAGTDGRFVAEADESDRSLLAYRPDVAVVTNAELDHPDAFASDQEVRDVFVDFLSRRRQGGVAILCLDDPGSAALVDRVEPPVLTYGEHPAADVRLLVDGSGRGRVRHGGMDVARLALQTPGRHNLVNATGAIAIALHEDVDVAAAADGLAGFTGAARRFQVLGTVRGITVVDDYAHHPTELRTTLEAARSREPDRVIAVVQPHRYSRTRVLGAELGRAAAAADVVVVTDVYASSEPAEPGVSGLLVAEAAEAAGARVIWEPHLSGVTEVLTEIAVPGDLVVVTGAGDVSQVGPAVLAALEDRHG